MTTLLTYGDREELMSSLAGLVAAELATAIDARGRASLAVPGGTTPKPLFEELRKKPLDWAAVTVLPTDERVVPESSPRSNARLVKEALLRDAAEKAQFLPLYRGEQGPEEFLDAVVEEVDRLLPLDVCVLGMGTDMHTASLFPGADKLVDALDSAAPSVLPIEAPGAGEPRLTLTAPVLQDARHLHLLITGEEKLAAFDRARADGPIADAPVRCILLPGERTTVHYAR